MVRIRNKSTARRLFREGQVIHLFPCKANINSPWWGQGIPISKEDGDTFDHLVNRFEFHNCNAEVGYYAHYYMKEGEQ